MLLYLSCVIHRLLLSVLLIAFVAGTIVPFGTSSVGSAMSDTNPISSSSMDHLAVTVPMSIDSTTAAVAETGEPNSKDCDSRERQSMEMGEACVASTCAVAPIGSPVVSERLLLLARVSPALEAVRRGTSIAPDPFPPKYFHLS